MTSKLKRADISAYLATPTACSREIVKLFKAGQPRVIFDVGACEGEDSIRFSRLFPEAKVYAFEPLPENQALVQANLEAYSAKACQLVGVALSDCDGAATFHVSSGRPAEEFAGKDWNYGNKSSSLLPPVQKEGMHGWLDFKESIRVRTQTLASFCSESGIAKIDFLHMDVQGAEYLVLSGAGPMLSKVTAIWMEVSSREIYKGQALDGEIREFMRSRGFILAATAYLGSDLGEGDHFYVNYRNRETWLYLAVLFVRKVRRRLLSFGRR